jgi:hypothetical protein
LPEFDLLSALVLHSTRDANPARLREGLQPSRDIDGIAEEIVVLNDDVANVDADAEPHLITGRPIQIRLAYGFLNRDRTLHGVHRAGEIGKNAVARCVEDPTAMRGDWRSMMTRWAVRVRRVPTSSSPIRRL